jgi:astacin
MSPKVSALLAIVIQMASAFSAGATVEIRQGSWRGRPVTYHVVNGWALVEGDILLAPVSELEALPPGKDTAARQTSAITSQFRYWPGGVVAYNIDSLLPNPGRVTAAMRHWEERTPIRFVERTNESSWVTFRSDPSGCNANVGMGGQTYVNLAGGCGIGTTIHEIGHTLGLWHAQSRIDRDRWIRVRYENVEKAFADQYDQQISDGQDVGPYDYLSVMHYSPYGFSRNGSFTLQSVPPGIPIGQRDGLTPLDIQAIHALYGKPLDSVTITSTPPGLKVLVDGAEHTTPARFPWASGETHELSAPPTQMGDAEPDVRHVFAHWSDEAAATHTVTVTAGDRVFDAHYASQIRVRGGVSEVEGEGAGRVVITPASEDGFYPVGARLRVEAIPAEGAQFQDWFPLSQWYLWGDAPNPIEFTVEDVLGPFVARFTSRPVTVVTANAPAALVFVDNEMYAAPVRFTWEPGTKHRLFMLGVDDYSPDTRHTFVKWSGAEGRTIEHTAGEGPAAINAEFKVEHLLEMQVDYWLRRGPDYPEPSAFRFAPSTPDNYFEPGAVVEITPPTSDRWQLTNWLGDGSGAAVPLRVTMTDGRLVTGNFLSYSLLNAAAIVHDARRQPGPVSPGQRLRIYWVGLSPDNPADAPAEGPLPTILGGVQVLFDSEPARLISVSKSELICVVPEKVKGLKKVGIVVATGRVGTTSVDVAVLPANAGVYTADGSGRGAALAEPVQPGAEVALEATGLQPGLATTVLIDEEPVQVLEVAAIPDRPGVWRIRARVPESAVPGVRLLLLLHGNRVSQPGVTITIAPRPEAAFTPSQSTGVFGQ